MNSLFKMDLTLEELVILESEILKKRKSKEAAWGLWAGLSFFGGHRFYTEDYGYASVMLLTSGIPIIAIILMLSTFDSYHGFNQFLLIIFILLLAGSLIWSWVDAFFLNKRIESYNNSVEANILNHIREERTLSRKVT